MRHTAVIFGLAAILSLPALAADSIHLSIDASKPGPRIDRNIFGQFAENLFDAGDYTHGSVTLPRVDAIAAKGRDGRILLAITNLDAENPAAIDTELLGITPRSARAETLTGTGVDSVNTFQSPNMVVPKPATVQIQNGRLSLTIEPRSVTVVSIEQ